MTMAELSTYVYAIAAAGTLQAPLRPQGLPDGRAPVAAITVGGAAAIVGRHDGWPLHGLPKPELLRRLAIHQRVIEDAMAGGDVLPTRFGTVLDSEDEVRAFLARWGGPVRESLARFAGLVEVEAAATWDLSQTLAGLAGQPAIVAARAVAQRAAPEHRIAEQVRVGQLVKQALDQRRAYYQEKLLNEVGPLAADSQPNVLVTDELVFNVAFLLPRCALPAFDAALERLDEALAGEISLRRVGPLPPYTFATVRVTRFDAERLAAGRALLGLPGEISECAVLSSYRRLACKLHPDHNATDPAAGQRFAALGAARDDLLAYCRSRPGTAAGPALMVAIERSGSGAAPEKVSDA
jgi:Gas vesicle synthesis protein GvpL/GvpF/DnaJ domain